LYYSTTFLYLLKEEIFVSSAEETSATLIPEADHEVVSLLEENGQEAALRNITNYQLESTEFERGYDIGFSRSSKTKTQSGTYFSSNEISPYYDGSEENINVDMETNIEEFYANLNGEFRIVDEDDIVRTYKLVMSCDEGIILKGETGFDEREVAEIRYKKEEDGNILQVNRDGQLENYGKRERGTGKDGSVRQHVEFIESVYRQLIEPQLSELETDGLRLQSYSQADARKDLKLLDRAFKNLKDSTVNSLVEFEEKQEARIDCQDHPFNNMDGNSTNGVKGGHAAQRIAHKFTRLNQTGVINYNVRVGGGHPSADVEIREELDDSFRTISDFEGASILNRENREQIVEERFEI
jgi:hypothetical protein